MKIYTRTGDDGGTALFGGARVSKHHGRVDAYGAVDELSSVLGVARSHGLDADLDALLAAIQNDLFSLGAELATVPGKEAKLPGPRVEDSHVATLERAIDRAETELLPLANFILPAGVPQAAFLHQARTVCRRAERSAVALHGDTPVRGEILRYINRLSDLLFVLARLANRRAGVADVLWNPRAATDPDASRGGDP